MPYLNCNFKISFLLLLAFLVSSCTLDARFSNLSSNTLDSDKPIQDPIFGAPSKPTGFIALATSTSTINLSWTSNNGAETKYRIAYAQGKLPPADCNSGMLIDQDLITGLNYGLTGLLANTRYTFRVCAINPSKSELISTGITATATTYKVPPPNPSGLSIIVHSSTGVTLTWNSGGGTTSGFRIAYQTGPVAPANCASGTQVSEYLVSGTSWYVNDLTAATQYSFRVCAVNSNPVPDVSTGITASTTTLGAPPPNPTGLTATVNTTSQITLSWTSGGGSTDGYVISYYAGPTAPANCYVGTVISAPQISGTSKAIGSLIASTNYSFRLCSVNADGSISAGVTITKSTFAGGQTLPGSVIPVSGTSVVTEVGTSEAKFMAKYIGGAALSSFTIVLNSGSTAPANCTSVGNVSNLSTSGFGAATYEESYTILAGLSPSTQYTGIICGFANSSYSTPTTFTFTTLSSQSSSANSYGEVSNLFVRSGFGGSSAEIWANNGTTLEDTFYYISYAAGTSPPPLYCQGATSFGSNSFWYHFSQTYELTTVYGGFSAGQTYTFRVCSSPLSEYSMNLNDRSQGVTYTWVAPSGSTPPSPVINQTTVSYNSVIFDISANIALTDEIWVFKEEGGTAGTACNGSPTEEKVMGANTIVTAANLKSNTLYTFTVCALGFNFLPSPQVVVQRTTNVGPSAPPDPIGFVITPLTQKSVRIDYGSAGGSTAGLKLLWNSTGVLPSDCSVASTGYMNLPSASMQATVNNLTPGLTYAFRLCAANSNIPINYSPGVTGTVTLGPTPPSDVVGLKVTSKTNSEISFEWSSSDATAVSFIATYLTDGIPADCSSGTVIPQSGDNKNSRTISGLSNGTYIGIRVCALNASTPASVSAGVALDAATNLSTTAEVISAVKMSSGRLLSFSFAGDSNGDGKDDLVFSGDNTSNIKIISGTATGSGYSSIRTFSTPGNYRYYGDYNKDGYEDLLLGKTSSVEIISGKDGSVLMSRDGVIVSDSFGQTTDPIGDLDSDGVIDFISTASTTRNATGSVGAIYAISAKSGVILWSYLGSTASEKLGTSAAVIDDINGDGHKDVIVGGPGYDGPAGVGSGRVVILSGINGNVVYTFNGETAASAFGTSVAALGDLLGTGDVVIGIGAPQHTGTAGTSSGKSYVYNAVSHSLIYSSEGTSANSLYGTLVSTIGDYDDDGRLDYAISAPGLYNQSGAVQFRSGVNNSILESLTGTLNFGSTLGLVGDFDHDGKPDIGIGTQNLLYIIKSRTTPVPP